jgi:lipid-binding SYLF domain-containing protein
MRQKVNTMRKPLLTGVALTVLAAMLSSCAAINWSASRIDHEANEALKVFRKDVNGAEIFLRQSAGYLVFPRVIKAGAGIGAETGEGVLRVRGQSVDYYRTTSGSIGFQAGAQAKSIVIAFLTQSALDQFKRSSGWKVGIDGSVALIDIGAGKSIDTSNVRDPVVGFVFGSKGLMYNLTLEGSKFTRLRK